MANKTRFRYVRASQVVTGMNVCVHRHPVPGRVYRVLRRGDVVRMYVVYHYNGYKHRSPMTMSSNHRIIARIPSFRAESGF